MKKLFRIKKEHKIAGVCTGLGEYFGLDPVFFRMIFLLLLFGFGVGILVYLIMWFAMPFNEHAQLSNQIQRLYLEEKDKKIAGVCSGLGEYFEMDPVFFRIVFLVTALIGGLGIGAYLILFFIAPSGKNKIHA